MNLRTKTVIIIAAVFLGAFLIMAFLLSQFILNGYSQEENRITRDDMIRAQAALDETLNTLSLMVSNWAQRDDTYAFMKKQNDGFTSNFTYSTFYSNRLNLAAILDNQGNLIFSQYYQWIPGKSNNLYYLEMMNIPDDLKGYLTSNSPLVNQINSENVLKGIISLNFAPMIIASHPILTGNGSGPELGTFIFGRYLDSIELSHLSQFTHLSITGYKTTSDQIPQDVKAVQPLLEQGTDMIVRVIDDKTIGGYSIQNDLLGQPSFILRIDNARVLYVQSQKDVTYFTLALISFGLLFIMAILLILEKMVISRVSYLSNRVSFIGQKGDLSARVSLPGKDEISSLATNINDMLGNLEQSRKLHRESETFNYALLQDSPNPIEVMNSDGSIRYVNPALERITGYSSNQLIGRKPPFPWWQNENNKQNQAQISRNPTDGVQRIEKRYYKPNGEPFWVEITSTAIKQDNEIKFVISNWVDITERKQAETALRESEKRFRELAELLPELVFETDLLAKLNFVNRVAFSVFGYPTEDYSGLSLIDLIAPEYRVLTNESMHKIIIGEDLGNIECIAIRKDGTRFPAFIHATPIKNNLGEVTGLRGILVDITSQKEIEAELRASEEFSSSLLDNAPNPIIVYNLDYSIRYINPALEKLTGFSSLEVIGKTAPYPWWLKSQVEQWSKKDQHSPEIESPGSERCYKKKNNTLFWITITNNPFVENGKVQYYVGNWVDITERKKTEDALKESEAFSSSLRDNSPYPIMVINPDTSIRYVNPALAKLTGFSSKELIGQKPPYPFWPEDQQSRFHKDDAKYILSDHTIEALLKKKNGDSFYVNSTSTHVMETENIKYYLSIWIDITAQKLASEQMQKLYQREKNLREALQSEINSRTEFTRALVHELKTPLTPIMASSELLVEELSEEPLLGLAKNVHRGAENMNRRVDELLDLARGEVGMLKVNLNPVDTEKLLKEVIKYMEPSAKNNGQSLDLGVPEQLPIIMADEDRVRQILFNLISNSIKYSLPGGNIEVNAREEDDNLIMEVHDTGRGMSQEEQEKLFQPYYRIEGRERLSGLGLGLALSRRLVELHNGKIWVKSQKGVGSIFFVSLPIKATIKTGTIAKIGG